MRYVAGKPLYVETPLWADNEPHRPNLDVDGGKTVNTGLLTAKGEPIYRVPDPIGFGPPTNSRRG